MSHTISSMIISHLRYVFIAILYWHTVLVMSKDSQYRTLHQNPTTTSYISLSFTTCTALQYTALQYKQSIQMKDIHDPKINPWHPIEKRSFQKIVQPFAWQTEYTIDNTKIQPHTVHTPTSATKMIDPWTPSKMQPATLSINCPNTAPLPSFYYHETSYSSASLVPIKNTSRSKRLYFPLWYLDGRCIQEAMWDVTSPKRG